MEAYSAYKNLIGEIAKNNLTNGEIAQQLHIHPNTFRNKIKGEKRTKSRQFLNCLTA